MGIVGTVDGAYKTQRVENRGIDGLVLAVAAPMALESRAFRVLCG
jgi:hypothetical protein